MHKRWKWKLTWTGFETSQVFFTVSTRPTTEQHRNITARPTSTRRGTANPECLTCTRAERRKRREAAPNLPQWVSHPGGSARQVPINNTRLTGGTHFDSTSFRVKTPNKPTEEVGEKGENRWTRVDLDARFLGSHWVQTLLTLDQGLDLEGHKSCGVFCITRNSALWCAALHSLIKAKEHLRLIFPCF